MFLDMEAATGQEVELCLECIEWAKSEKRTFLRQALEVSTPSFVNQPGTCFHSYNSANQHPKMGISKNDRKFTFRSMLHFQVNEGSISH